jgi:hypothetical protein
MIIDSSHFKIPVKLFSLLFSVMLGLLAVNEIKTLGFDET